MTHVRPRRGRTLVPAVLTGILLVSAGCSPAADPSPESPESTESTESTEEPEREVVVVSPPDPDAPRHTHETVIGDGTSPRAGGYRMEDVSFPGSTDEPGLLTFRIVGPDGLAVRDYVEEQTKLLHLYVVRDDVAVFRHLHPEQRRDGTWAAYVALAEPGTYRVVAEFVPDDRAGGSHLVLASSVRVGAATGEDPSPLQSSTESAPAPGTADDGIVSVVGPATMAVGRDEEIVLTISDGAGGALNFGTYLGSFAHLTGFDTETGAFVHVHPLGAPTTTENGSELSFHTDFAEPGRYRFFVQVRVDGFVHTLPLDATVV